MSIVELGMDALLGLLLLAALALGVRLNGKLTSLREGQASFVKAVAALDAAAVRAEAGLAALRAATLDAHDHLLGRIETARALADRLDHATSEHRLREAAFNAPRPELASRRPVDPSAPPPPVTSRAPGAALARFVARRDGRTSGRSA